MTQASVEKFLGRLLTDDGFRQRAVTAPDSSETLHASADPAKPCVVCY
ncbi:MULTISPECIES: hypothetical protein [Geobacter]|nr:hypothetical protein [Geobacter sulfurreducens]BET57351.1 hypothetical protein GEO60473_03910 [Geobacter sp. 60473]